MTEELSLSKRLELTASFIDTSEPFADIGSDHAYLPCFLCQQDERAHGIAGELNEGPYTSAKQTVQKYGLKGRINVRLGDGLSVLKNEQNMQVIIAGMGGSLIRNILENGKQKLINISRIVAQPNIDARDVREIISTFSFQITNEIILEENGHIYEIIVADYTRGPLRKYTAKEMLFGPILLKEKPAAFHKKWQLEKLHYERIIEQMNKAKIKDHLKIAQYQQELSWIKEVITDGATIDEHGDF